MTKTFVSELGKSIRTKLEASGLVDHCEALLFEEVDAEGMQQMGYAKRGGFSIPYFDLDGHPTKFHRVRYLEDPPINGFKFTPKKVQKYAQPPGTLNELYVPPLVPWREIAGDADIVLTITEGELKAACACAHDIPTIGLGGVFNFRAAKHGLNHLPMFDEIEWKGRPVYICFDSDAVTNPMVKAAESMLMRLLTTLGAIPHIVRLPPDGDDKVGLDDFLMAHGADDYFDLCAKAEAPDPLSLALHGMNAELVVVTHPACIYHLQERKPIKYGDFVNLIYTGKVVETIEMKKGVKLIEHPIAKKWLEWPGRNVVRGLEYSPGEPLMLSDGRMNLWQGWAVQPHKGDVGPFMALLDYIFESDAAAKSWFLQWLAYPIQHPGTKLFTSAILWGAEQGTGKSLVGKIMKKIYGEHGAVIDEERLRGKFNAWQQNLSFCVGEETTGSDSRALANKMKEMITRTEVWVEPKGIDPIRFRDHVNYIFLSNHPDAFKLDITDRRYFVWEMPSKKQTREFYKMIDAWMRSDNGLPALMNYLLHVDTSDFDPMGAAPLTSAKLAMVSIGQSDHAQWLEQWLLNPTHELITADELVALYEPDSSRRKVRANGMARALRELKVNLVNNRMGVLLTNKTQPRIYAVSKDPKRRELLEHMRSTELRAIYEKERVRSKVR